MTMTATIRTIAEPTPIPGWPDAVREIRYTSAADNTPQPCLVFEPQTNDPVPLLVALHTWSSDYRQPEPHYAEWCIKNQWAMLHPHFRGPNQRPEACGSELAVKDILSAVDFARTNMKINPDRIYLIGVSGGGHMALLMAGRAPEIWAAVSAWCGISDLTAWHAETKRAGHRYWKMLEAVCGGPPGVSPETDAEYRQRSPLTWLQHAAQLPLDINAGITDGHNGSVPVSHSIHAFNRLATAEDQVPTTEINALRAQPRLPAEFRRNIHDPLYGNNPVLYRRTSNQARLTLFQGGHQIVPHAALTWLAAQHRGKPADWTTHTTTENPDIIPSNSVDSGL